MPFDTVGGLPPMPTHLKGASVYFPRPGRSLVFSPHRRPPNASAIQPSHSTVEVAAQEEGSREGLSGAEDAVLLPSFEALPTRTISDDRGVAKFLDTAPSTNAWRPRTTLAHLKHELRCNPQGVAQFRPTLMPCHELDASASQGTKPLLEPFQFAEDLSRKAAVETWQVRKSRYLQWLRKDAIVALEEEFNASIYRACSQMDNTFISACRLGNETGFNFPPSKVPVDAGDGSAAQTAAHPPTTRLDALPRISPLPVKTTGEATGETLTSHHPLGQSLPPVEGSPSGGLPGSRRLNPNEEAVRLHFRVARTAAAASSSRGSIHSFAYTANTALQTMQERDWQEFFPALGDPARMSPSVLYELGKLADCEDFDLRIAMGATPSLYSPSGQAFVSAALENEITRNAGVQGNMTGSAYPDNNFTAHASLAPFRAAFENKNTDVEPSDSVSSVTLPPEYEVAGLLRNRMHKTVALFTPSSKQTLDDPPVKQGTLLTRTKPRLATDTATQAPLLFATRSGRSSEFTVHNNLDATFSDSILEENLYHQLQRLLYDEAYERGVLLQLAIQSSPTRWYSTSLPSGGEGIRFRHAHPPEMRTDDAVRRRLRSSTLEAVQKIAQPRIEAVEAATTQRSLAAASKATNDEEQFTAAEHSALMLAQAVTEKVSILEAWSRLHVILLARLGLFAEETVQRRALLGEFMSCRFPASCRCGSSDREVLSRSAAPRTPTIRPLCLYVAVVLARYKDVLQESLFYQYQLGYDNIYRLFRIEYIARYTYDKLQAEESRRFNQLMRYNEFCLRVAEHQQHIATHHQGESPPANNSSRALIGEVGSGAAGDVTRDASGVIVHTVPNAQRRASLFLHGDRRMWRLRQRRLQYAAAFDSPFFSYVVYTELLTATAVEDERRAYIAAAEVEELSKLRALKAADESSVVLTVSERQQRLSIEVECDQAHNVIYAGSMRQLHAAFEAERRAEELAKHESACEKDRQQFVAAALREKMVTLSEHMASHRHFIVELRQHCLSMLVACRSSAESKAVSHDWLSSQKHTALFHLEQCLRDRIVFAEEPDAFVRLLAAAKASLKNAAKSESHRVEQENAILQQKARKAEERARERELVIARAPWKRIASAARVSDCRPESQDANTFTDIALELEEDLAIFLPSVANSSL